MSKSKAPGRPAGSPNQKLSQAEAKPSHCPKCGSARRGPYRAKQVQEFHSTDSATGEPFTHIIRRRTVCLDCGQHRVDRALENRPALKKRH